MRCICHRQRASHTSSRPRSLAQRAILFTEMWRGKWQTIAEETATIMLSGSGGRRQLRAATMKGPARAGRTGADPVAAAVLATTPPSAHGRGVKRRVREGEEGVEEEVEVEAVEIEEDEEVDEEVEAVEMEEQASLPVFTEEQIEDVVRAMKEMRNNRKQDTAVVHGVEISFRLRKTEGSGPPGDIAAVDPRDRKTVKSLPKLEEKLRAAVRK